jgi:HAD superfamily hydrolase (TIGR01509 family)
MQRWSAIFDWDGVILDSSGPHELAWERIAQEERRLIPPGCFQKSFGMKNEKVIPELLGWAHEADEIRRLSLRKEALYREILKESGVVPLPGVLPWLQTLRSGQVPCAVASSTHRLNIEAAIDTLGVRPFFAVILAGEDVALGKPNPEVFLQAARKLGAAPERCVVFEDAHVGIEAALTTGMRVVAVATTHPFDSLHRAHRVVRQLDELTLADLEAGF